MYMFLFYDNRSHHVVCDVRIVLAEFSDLSRVVSFDLNHVMNVRTVDELVLPLLERVKLSPQVSAEGVRTVAGLYHAVEDGVLSVILIESAYGVFTVLDLEPLTHVYVLGRYCRIVQRISERSAVPEKLGVFIAGVTDGKLTEEGNLLASGCASEKDHRDTSVHIRLAGNNVAHISEYAVRGTGHSADSKLHSSPALSGDSVELVFVCEVYVEKDESVNLFKQRRCEIIHLVSRCKKSGAFGKLLFSLFEDLVVLVNYNSEVYRYASDTELLHQLPFVEDNGGEGLGSESDNADADTVEVLYHAGYVEELLEVAVEFLASDLACFYVREGNVKSLKKSGCSEYTALRVCVSHAVCINSLVERSPDAYGLLHSVSYVSYRLFVSEVSIDEEYTVNALSLEVINYPLGIVFVYHNVDGVDSDDVNELGVGGRVVCLDVVGDLASALFSDLPVEYTGAGSYVTAKGNETDLQLVV